MLTRADFDAGNNPCNLKVDEALIQNLTRPKYAYDPIAPISAWVPSR